MTPRLSIVVETVNTPAGDRRRLDACLAALAAQTLAASAFEVIVAIDPAVHPRLAAHVAAVAPAARTLDARGRHYYAQKNLGARAARADVVAFIDSDCVPASTWAAAIVEAFARADAALGAVQGTIDCGDSVAAKAFLVTSFPDLQTRAARATRTLTGNNSAFRRCDLVASPFDETPVFHGPEVRTAARLRREGRAIVLLPQAANRHYFTPGLGGFLTFGTYWGWCFLALRRDPRADVRYARLFRTLGPASPLVLAPAKAALDTARLLRRRRDLGLGAGAAVVAAGLLWAHAAAVGLGAALAVVGREPPVPPY